MTMLILSQGLRSATCLHFSSHAPVPAVRLLPRNETQGANMNSAQSLEPGAHDPQAKAASLKLIAGNRSAMVHQGCVGPVIRWHDGGQS